MSRSHIYLVAENTLYILPLTCHHSASMPLIWYLSSFLPKEHKKCGSPYMENRTYYLIYKHEIVYFICTFMMLIS